MAATGLTTTARKAAVLYHYPCPDGAFAALAAHLCFSAASVPTLFFPNTVYNPITPQTLPLHQITHLYLLDFVGPSGFVHDLSSKVGNLVILDHHKTALETLGGEKNVTKIIDLERSGATIAFDYFKERVADNAAALAQFDRVWRLFEYIEDGDLWRWSLPNSKAFSSGLKDLNIEFDVGLNPSLFDQLLSLDLDSVISQGMKSLPEKQRLIDEALSQSYEIALGDGRLGHCLAVDADSIAELRSELGQQLATKSHNQNLRGIGAVAYRVPELENDQLLKISLRSLESEDTTLISEEFGGGGHRNASSFMLSLEKFDKWK
ncbi:DHHA1 domain protein, partial [Parasponia andersonii]